MAYKMTCFLLRDGRRHKINAFLLLCGHKVSKFCGCGRECNTDVAVAGGNGQKFSGSGMKKTVPRRALIQCPHFIMWSGEAGSRTMKLQLPYTVTLSRTEDSFRI